MDTKKKQLLVFIASDSTGDLASDTVQRTLEQYRDIEAVEERFTLVDDAYRLADIFRLASERRAVVVYTFAKESMRANARDAAYQHGVPALGLLVDVYAFFSILLKQKPMQRPGHKITSTYLEEWDTKLEAIKFTQAHDDGQELESIADAQVVIVGVSRVSKSPLCAYLAYQHNLRAANVPIVLEVDPPQELDLVPPERVFLLKKSAERLSAIRRLRTKEMGAEKAATLKKDYIDIESILVELAKAEHLANSRGWKSIDTTDRSIEETASRIIQKLTSNARAIATE